MRFRIRVKLVLAVCVPLTPVFAAVSGIDYYTATRQAVDRTEREMKELTARVAVEIEKGLAPVEQTAKNTASLLTRSPLREKEQLEKLLFSNVRDTPHAFGSAVAYEPGEFAPDLSRFSRYVCRDASTQNPVRKEIAYDYLCWDWYQLPKRLGRPVWTEPYLDRGAGDVLMCTYSAPFFRNQTFQGVVTVDISLESLRRELGKVHIKGGYCLIVSRTGTFVSHPNESRILHDSIARLAERCDSPELADVGKEMTEGQRGMQRLVDVETGRPAWFVYAPIESVGWSVAAVIPEDEVMADVYAEQNRQAALFGAGLAASILLVMLVTAWITRPIARLAVAAKELAAGNLDVQTPEVRGDDEITEFAHTFQTMVRDLKAAVEQRLSETAARESIERELQVARRIQTSLLPMARPPFPERKEFSLDAHNEPARIVAGDFFDYWLVGDDVLALVVADVCGKGVPAAMFMAVTRTILRHLSKPGQSPSQIISLANRILVSDNREQMFVTAFYAHYHIRDGELIFCNAGHNPPYLVSVGGKVVSLGPPTGTLVGVFEDARYEDGRVGLAPGDVLAVYTDGVTEAADADTLFGEERLEQLLAATAGSPVDAVRRRILQEVKAYCHGEAQDDVTLLVLKREA
jgi:sigma-B regulation protein RsbU (phosphoserine phosphatase)